MSDRARYTTQAKADAKHSTLKAVRHLKQHMKHLSLKVISHTLEVIQVEEVEGVVCHHVDDVGNRELEFDLEIRLHVRVTNVRGKGESYTGHVYFDVTSGMTEEEPVMNKVVWAQRGGPRGLAFTQCEGVVRSSRTRNLFRSMIEDFQADFLHYEATTLIEGAEMHQDGDDVSAAVEEVEYSDTESEESTPRNGNDSTRGTDRSVVSTPKTSGTARTGTATTHASAASTN